MFSGKEILQSVVLVVIGGIVAVLASKLLEGDEGAAAQREIRGEDELNEAKQPQEHDERFCWQGVCGCFNIKNSTKSLDVS